jgi:tRNA dimethylallyltransferase
MNPVFVLGGPTAAGKTAAAVAVAKRFDAVVVSADAMQVYRGLDIGTGKATLEERQGVLHYGLDVVDIPDAFDAANFVALADDVLARHPRVVVAGGTSLYLQGLLRGFVVTPAVDPGLYARLCAVDPVLAERLHPNDRVRLVRGVEVFLQSGQRLSELQSAHALAPDRIRSVGFWLDREGLNERIDHRVLQMMDSGYLEEMRQVLALGHDRGLKPLLSLGYRHLAAHLLDGLPLEEAVRCTQRDTRRFAKKQRTWQNALAFERVDADDHDRLFRAAAELWGEAG